MLKIFNGLQLNALKRESVRHVIYIMIHDMLERFITLYSYKSKMLAQLQHCQQNRQVKTSGACKIVISVLKI